jgi:hypothetical protein
MDSICFRAECTVLTLHSGRWNRRRAFGTGSADNATLHDLAKEGRHRDFMTGCPSLQLRLVLCLSLAFVATACNPSTELTRSRAKRIVEGTKDYSEPLPAQFTLDAENVRKGIQLGMWTEQKNIFGGSFPILTPGGKKLLADSSFAFGQLSITTLVKTKRNVLEITGITDAPEIVSGGKGTAKIVEFTWSWDIDPLPRDLKILLGKVTAAQRRALLRLYDDGWRFDSFE